MNMLNVFPSFLILGIFAPLILRIVVGVYLFKTGYQHLGKEKNLVTKEVSEKFNESFATPIVVIGALFEIVVGLSLVAGIFTQAMALIGMLYMVKMLVLKNQYPAWMKHERLVYIAFFAILLSLLFTGAGALAIDLPL